MIGLYLDFFCRYRSVARLFMAMAALYANAPALADISYVQGTSVVNFSGASVVTAAFSGGQGSGDLNVIVVGWCDVSASVQSVTDTSGNTYALAVGPSQQTAAGSQSIYYARNVALAAGNTVTVTFDRTACSPDVRIAEYSGLDPVNPLDAAAGGSGLGTLMSSDPVTTTNPKDLLVGSNYVVGVTTGAGQGFTQRLFTNYDDILEDEVVNTAGTYSATAQQNGNLGYVMQVVAFRAAVSAPTSPGGFFAVAASNGEIDLSWAASVGPAGVSTYQIERCQGDGCTDFVALASTADTFYNDVGLTTSTTYTYRVAAVDAAGDVSGYSNSASATTGPGVGATPPSAPGSLAATAVSNSEIDLSWGVAADAAGVGGYLLERCQGLGCTDFQQVASIRDAAYTDAGLSVGVPYSYRVRADDSAGNLGAYSNVATATPGTGFLCD